MRTNQLIQHGSTHEPCPHGIACRAVDGDLQLSLLGPALAPGTSGSSMAVDLLRSSMACDLLKSSMAFDLLRSSMAFDLLRSSIAFDLLQSSIAVDLLQSSMSFDLLRSCLLLEIVACCRASWPCLLRRLLLLQTPALHLHFPLPSFSFLSFYLPCTVARVADDTYGRSEVETWRLLRRAEAVHRPWDADVEGAYSSRLIMGYAFRARR